MSLFESNPFCLFLNAGGMKLLGFLGSLIFMSG